MLGAQLMLIVYWHIFLFPPTYNQTYKYIKNIQIKKSISGCHMSYKEIILTVRYWPEQRLHQTLSPARVVIKRSQIYNIQQQHNVHIIELKYTNQLPINICTIGNTNRQYISMETSAPQAILTGNISHNTNRQYISQY